ncbi:MAG: hypothetical protein U0X76_12085 [Bacteroidia bacterium]
MTVVTGVSGSGKTSRKKSSTCSEKIYGGYGEQSGAFDKISGDYSKISAVEFVDQNPIGKSSRSNPVTYVKAYDEIRALFLIYHYPEPEIQTIPLFFQRRSANTECAKAKAK